MECVRLTPFFQSEDDDSGTESEFEADSGDSGSSESSNAGSDYFDGSNASEDEGSGSDFDDDSEGEDWDELEKKAAKCLCYSSVVPFESSRSTSSIADKKRAEAGLGHGSDEESDRPKKKAAPKAANGKNGKTAVKGKSKR